MIGKNWTEWEHEEFRRNMRELLRRQARDLRDRIAGLTDADPAIAAYLSTHEHIELGDGETYGVLMSMEDAAEMEAIRGDAILYAAEDADTAGGASVDLLGRIIDVLGRVYVRVRAPHEEAGRGAFEDLSAALLLAAFEIAYSRRPEPE